MLIAVLYRTDKVFTLYKHAYYYLLLYVCAKHSLISESLKIGKDLQDFYAAIYKILKTWFVHLINLPKNIASKIKVGLLLRLKFSNSHWYCYPFAKDILADILRRIFSFNAYCDYENKPEISIIYIVLGTCPLLSTHIFADGMKQELSYFWKSSDISVILQHMNVSILSLFYFINPSLK